MSEKSESTVAYVRKRLFEGVHQHDIAAELGVNQGRISEINTGKRESLRARKQPPGGEQLSLI